MKHEKTIESALAAAQKAGADEAVVTARRSEKSELNVDAGKMSLYRTTETVQLSLVAYVKGSKGSSSTDRFDAEGIALAAGEAVAAARSAPSDPANAIAPASAPGSDAYGDERPDSAAMYDRLTAFVAWVSDRFSKTKLEQCILQFVRGENSFGNSDGVRMESRRGLYDFSAMFTTKDGARASSFNYSGATLRSLERPLEDWGGLAELLRQSAEQLDPGSVGGKFVGDLIVTPHCLGDFVGALDEAYLGGYSLIKGTSPWKDSLGKEVASPLLTLESLPRSVDTASFFTSDGFEDRDWVAVEKGMLRNFDLDLYAANKTGKTRSPGSAGFWSVRPGASSLAEMIAGTKRGLLLCRFSGGNPAENGDFSGVAKNSYYIEDGKLVRPVTETMVSGNVGGFIASIDAVSKELIDFGSARFPWVRGKGVTISGK